MNNPFIEDIKSQYRNGSALIKLIFVNIAVFLLVSLLHVVFLLFNVDELFNFYSNGERAFKLTIWLSANSDIVELLQKPWSIITYMFLHENFMHILFNMIMLYFSGRLFTQYLSDKKLVTTYLVGGISGLIFYVLAYNLFPFFKYPAGIPIMGASASVMAVLIAIATYAPKLKIRLVFIGEVKLMYVAAFFVILDILNLKGGLNEGGYIAHLGGAFFGYIYIKQLKKGRDLTLWFGWFLNYLVAMFKPRKKMKTVYRSTSSPIKNKKPITDHDYNTKKKDHQKQVDKILDKISKSGYDSLSAEEKAILFDASKK